MKNTCILGILISNRTTEISRVQDTLTKFGCSIRTRLGLHDVEDGSRGGIILLELTGDPEEFLKLQNELLAIDGVEVKKMVFG